MSAIMTIAKALTRLEMPVLQIRNTLKIICIGGSSQHRSLDHPLDRRSMHMSRLLSTRQENGSMSDAIDR